MRTDKRMLIEQLECALVEVKYSAKPKYNKVKELLSYAQSLVEKITISVVSDRTYDWKKEQAAYFCENRECLFFDLFNYGCKQRSDAKRCAARICF